jgi:hypothetical protein
MAADIYERIGNAIGGNGGILQNMIDQLDFDATNPSKRDGGMSQSYISDLDRVDKKKLKDDDTCPICTERFLDGRMHLMPEIAPADTRDRPISTCRTPALSWRAQV